MFKVSRKHATPESFPAATRKPARVACLISSVAAMIAGTITFVARMAFWFGGSRDDEDRGSPIAAMAMMILAPIAAMLIQMAISRSREYDADATMRIGGLSFTFAPIAHPPPCYAARVTDGSTTIVCAADGGASDTVERLAHGVDLPMLS